MTSKNTERLKAFRKAYPDHADCPDEVIESFLEEHPISRRIEDRTASALPGYIGSKLGTIKAKTQAELVEADTTVTDNQIKHTAKITDFLRAQWGAKNAETELNIGLKDRQAASDTAHAQSEYQQEQTRRVKMDNEVRQEQIKVAQKKKLDPDTYRQLRSETGKAAIEVKKARVLKRLELRFKIQDWAAETEHAIRADLIDQASAIRTFDNICKALDQAYQIEISNEPQRLKEEKLAIAGQLIEGMKNDLKRYGRVPDDKREDLGGVEAEADRGGSDKAAMGESEGAEEES